MYALLPVPASGAGVAWEGRNSLAADRLVLLLGVIAAHAALIVWLTLAMDRSEPRLTAQEPLMTGVLLAPPAPQPVIEPPRPLPMEQPVARRAPESTPPPVVPETPAEPPVIQPESVSENAITEPAPAVFALPPAEEGVAGPEPPRVTPPRVDASQLDNPKPDYPPVSRRLREQGEVLLDVYILPDGSVGEIRLKRSSGHARLDRSALEAVRRWRYVPASRGGEPIPYWYIQPIAFLLNN